MRYRSNHGQREEAKDAWTTFAYQGDFKKDDVSPFVVLKLDWDEIEANLPTGASLGSGICLSGGKVAACDKNTFQTVEKGGSIQIKGDLSQRPKFPLIQISQTDGNRTLNLDTKPARVEWTSRVIHVNAVNGDGALSAVKGRDSSEVSLDGNYVLNTGFLRGMLGKNGRIVSSGKSKEEALRAVTP